MVKIAIVQMAPIFMDKVRSTEKAVLAIEEAAEQGAELVVFGETWLSGYPAWLDYSIDYARWDVPKTKKIFAEFYHNAVSVKGDEIKQLRKQAKKRKVSIVIGINEKTESGPANKTIFNSLVIINSSGEIANHHRKLMPTYTEKLLYGLGDGSGLKSVDLGFGRLTGLICWEHWMPLSRQALHNSGEDIHIALWPKVHEMHQVCSRQYAFEGRCFVVAVGQILQAKDLPSRLKLIPDLSQDPNQMILNGGSCIIRPNGQYAMDPVFDKEEIIYSEIDLNETIQESMTLDTSGHYQRPDVFDFSINEKRQH